VPRTVLIGPVLGIAIFTTLAPYGEMRFAYPSVMLMFAALGLALSRLPRVVQMIGAALIALLAAATAFNVSARDFLIAGAIAGIIGGGVVAVLLKSATARRLAPFAVTACVLALMMYAYVNFKRYVIQCDADSSAAYSDPGAYGTLGDVWRFVREDLPKHTTIAYANTYFTYPLMGYAYDHKVVYAPTRAGLDRFVDMPPIEEKITGEQIVAHVVALLRENPDRAQWLTRLRESKADYLVIAKKLAETKSEQPPPEMKFVAELPHNFVKLFENEAGVVYKIRK